MEEDDQMVAPLLIAALMAEKVCSSAVFLGCHVKPNRPKPVWVRDCLLPATLVSLDGHEPRVHEPAAVRTVIVLGTCQVDEVIWSCSCLHRRKADQNNGLDRWAEKYLGIVPYHWKPSQEVRITYSGIACEATDVLCHCI